MRFIMAKHPQWAIKHKRKRTELRLINGRYYLYEVSSKWDPDKKRSKKITGKLLGRITKEDGFIESEKAKLRKQSLIVSNLSVKEYGITAFIDNHLSRYKDLLEKYFPEQWKIILVLTYGRLIYQSPLKRIAFHYTHSYLSEQYKGLSLSAKSLSVFLRELGTDRKAITDFFKEFTNGKNNIIFDGTDLISYSRKMEITKLSKSKKGNFQNLINLIFAFSVDLQLPVYYRIVAGNIKDIKAFKLSLTESQISNAVIIADKGFYSQKNIEELNGEKLKYIIPLKRNNKLIKYNKVKTTNKKSYEGFFKYQGRIIWFYTHPAGRETINVYLDEELKTKETKDYLNRIETLPDNYNINTFYNKQNTFGTIAFIHNTDKTPEETYVDYKSRGQVETMIDTLKNIIDADKSYMQDEQALEAWTFINYIALHWYYRIYQLLVKNELTNKYSPMDFLLFLKEIRKVKINDKWYLAETITKTKDLLERLKIHIT